MLFKLSLKNIRKSVKDYAIYFVTMVLGVAIFYIFNAIETQVSFLTLTEVSADAIAMMMEAITGISVFIALVLGLLIVYASRYLMKRRNREFALYMTLGMRKGTIAGILTVESLAVGVLSLVVGLVVGILLSQLMSTFVAQLFEADMTQFAFTFSSNAFLKTILYFGIIMVAVLLFNLINVGKARLIRLLQSGTRAEKVRMKNPVLCVILFLIGAGCLVFAYWRVTTDAFSTSLEVQILLPIFVGIVGTFLVFWSVSGLLLVILSKIRKTYYKGLNSFTFRQFSSRINTMVVSITVICVMLFFTIAVLSAAFSLRTSLNRNLQELTPVDADIYKVMKQDDDLQIFPEEVPEKEANRRFSLTMEEALTEVGCDPKELFSDYLQVSVYGTEDFTMGDAFGEWKDEVEKDFPNLFFGAKQLMMTESDYNKVAALFGKEPVELGPDEYAILCNTDISKPVWDRVLAGGITVKVFGHELKPKYAETLDGFVDLSASFEETGLHLIPDEVADPSGVYRTKILGNYRATDDEGRAEKEKELWNAFNKISADSEFGFVRANTKLDIRSASVSLSAVVTFLGLYLGFVFLISGAAVLALKAISDSIDSKGRYHMLRQLGAEEKEITASLRKQQALLFGLPLLLAIVHSIFGIKFSEMVFQSVGAGNTVESMLLTAAIILVIYGCYFLVTFFTSRRIIRE